MTETLRRPHSLDDRDTPEEARGAGLPFRRAYLVVLLVATGALYCWNITVNGMGNKFYAAAVAAGSHDWEAWLFGSLDSQNFITVDKPPLAQWVMGLSGRLFGFSSASMLLPEAVMAVASVALCHAAVARIAGRWTGLLAGAVLAVMPVAVLMFRFNNPDAAMVLLMMAAAYCTVRALGERSDGGEGLGERSDGGEGLGERSDGGEGLGERSDGESHGARWLALAGAAIGLAFLAKMLEGVLVLPALGAAYLLAAPVSMRRRWLHLLAGAAAMLASAGWFVVLTLLWPASARPFLAGSTNNSFMDLVVGYNGFARVLGQHPTGDAPPGEGGPQVATHYSTHSEGPLRLLSGEFGYEIGWLLPTALVVTALVFVARGRRPRTDRVRAGAVLFGGWLVVDGAVLTFMHGMIHPYYTLSIAPPIAAMFAVGIRELWMRREERSYRAALATVLLGTGVFGWYLLNRTATWLPALRWTIAAAAVLATVGLVSRRLTGNRPWAAPAALALGVTAALAGPTAYAVDTVGNAHTGGGPLVGHGPVSDSKKHDDADDPHLSDLLRHTTTTWSAAVDRSRDAASLELSSGTAVMAIGGFTGTDPAPTFAQFQDDVANGRIAYYVKADTNGRRPGWHPRLHVDITNWVAATFPATKVGDATVYDLRSH